LDSLAAAFPVDAVTTAGEPIQPRRPAALPRLAMAHTWIKKALIETGALRLASRFAGQGVAILIYHSVMNDPACAQMTLGDIVHSTDVFRRQMELIASHFRPVSLEDVFLFLIGRKNLPPRAVVVTFDDGYADNYQVANEILNPLGIPGVFYVTVDCIDRQRLPWPSFLRYAFLTSNMERWPDAEGKAWPLTSNEQRARAFYRAAEQASRLSGKAQEDFIRSVERQLETDPIPPGQRFMMTWDELRGLVRTGHVVGSHTLTHPNMAHIAESDVRTELSGSKQKLERELATPIVHFAYPCPALQPHWLARTVSASREAGYQTAVTTSKGLVRKHDDPLSLRRVRPTKTVDGLRWNLERAFAVGGSRSDRTQD
jgi:peptidoglycan/xylan/chitin deacetylase (PgdA/CDA1 family)